MIRQTDPPELLLLAVRFCKAYKTVYQYEYWLGKKWIEGADDPRTEADFRALLAFLKAKGVPMYITSDCRGSYLEFGLRQCLVSNGGQVAATPKTLVSKIMLERYCLQSPNEAPIVPMKVDRQTSLASARAENQNAYRQWTEADKELLRQQFLAGGSVDQLGTRFGRKPSAVQSQLFKLGLVSDWRLPFTSPILFGGSAGVPPGMSAVTLQDRASTDQNSCHG